MKTAALKEQFINLIEYHYERELWHSRTDQEYKESIDPFVGDLIRLTRRHNRGFNIQLYKFDRIEGTHVDDTSVDYIIGKKIEDLRTQKGWTVTRLANKAGINADYLRSVERGELMIGIWDLKQIVSVFKLESSAILPF